MRLRSTARVGGAVFAACWLAIAASRAAGPYFVDATAEAGLASKPGFRLSVADVNGDGYPDILLHRQANATTGDWLNKQYLLLNVPGDVPGDPFSRKFVDVTADSGIRANRAGTSAGRHSDAAIFADVDNDGDLDLFTSVYVHDNFTTPSDKNDLMLNDGAGHFTLAPNSPFHTEMLYNTAGAVFVDYDNDGRIDLYIGNWYRNSQLTADQLYRGNGDGSFANVSTASGIASKTTCIYGIAAFDWNDDGYTDLFAPPYAWTVLDSIPLHWRNNGDGTFTRVEAQTNYDDYRGTASTVASFGSMPRDFDNDGDIDFFEILTHGKGDCAGSVHSTAVTNNAGVFSWDFNRVCGRAAEDPDLTHHGDHYQSWFDFDGDGLSDFALTESGYGNNRLYLFRQAPDHSFAPVTVESGLNDVNIANLPPHNVIPLDFDLDGDEDLLVGFADDVTGIRLYENVVGTANNHLTVILEGGGGPSQANRAAIGAKVQVTAGGITQTREIYAGNGHMGPQVPLALTFGLGSASTVDAIRVRWPNAGRTVTERTNLAVNQFVRIAESCAQFPPDPANLLVRRDGGDLMLAWDDPAVAGLTFNVYREPLADPSSWGTPHAAGVTDGDPTTPGIQYRDTGAVDAGSPLFYRVTSVNGCGESPKN